MSVMTFAIIRANASTAAAFGTLHSAVFDASFSGSASMNSLVETASARISER